ncbi:9590_t:CDS:2 [Racocetra fulgida]|uniref:9590_t:CDS:1 n=1 Tax=Racocetra fulgida TaxID=60492 RepID=A0A9N9GC66_9GLOM|nr:9590_t:CDS:2 [Racocetra fulgida]
MHQILTYPGDLISWSSRMHKIYGDIYEVYIARERCIWVCRGDLCEAIYNSPNKFLLRTTPNNGLDEIGVSKIGLSFNRNWELWKYFRGIVTKSLTKQKFLKDSLEYIQVFWEEMEGYLNEIENLDDDNKKILDFSKWIACSSTDLTFFLTTRQNVHSLINYYSTLNQNFLQNTPKSILESPEDFIENITFYLESWLFFAFTPKFIRMLPSFKKRVKFYYERRTSLRKDIQKIIQKRREEIDNVNAEENDKIKNQDNDDELSSDLLTAILTMNTNRNIKSVEDNENNMYNKHMTDDEITGLLLDVVAGGVETVMLKIYQVACYCEWNKRMLNELDQTFGSGSDYKIELDAVNQLKYCEAIIKEVQMFRLVSKSEIFEIDETLEINL